MPSPVQVGEIIAGKYRVDAIIGQGGMGVVVAATDTILDRRVAVKFLLPQYAENEVAAGRFLREARATARLNSQHAVRIIEVGELESGSPFMTMEYLEGVDLGTLIEQQGALELKVGVDYALQAARGLAEAHAAGIIHRDVKPSNLFLAYQPAGKPVVKVLDFGVSKLHLGIEATAGSLTTTGQTLGSPLYMAPEQMRSSHHADARSDIWGLGVVLFELLTGTRPFSADSLAELVLVINQDPPLDPATLRPDLPPALCAVILRCLEKDPNRRFATIAELAAELAPFGSRNSRAAVADIRNLEADVKIPGAPPVGRLGTLIVSPDNPDAARLRALGDSVLGSSSQAGASSVSPSIAYTTSSGTSPLGSMSSAPWASTNDEAKRGGKPRKKNSGMAVVLGSAAVLLLALVGVGLSLFTGGAKDANDSDIVSAASELSRAATDEKPEAPDPSAATEPTTEPGAGTAQAATAMDTASASVTVVPEAPSDAPTASSTNEPTKRGPAKKKSIRRVRPEKPKSAKDRLGF